MRTALMLGLMFTLTVSFWAETRADDALPCQVHVILFVPSDVKTPTGYQQRVDQIVSAAESFFKREFQRWGHKNIVMPFRRSADGHVEVTTMRGTKKLSDYKSVTVRAEVMSAMRRQNKLEGGRQVWWIMVYPGDPPARFKGYLGGFGWEIGGWSVCNLDTREGHIDPTAPLGAEFSKKLFLKGMIHELGHGFQLPHIGPRKLDRAGNTLMGPTHLNFQRVVPAGERRIYLSEAAAAMLSTHPAFRGAPDDRRGLPKIATRNMTYAVDARRSRFIVGGRVSSPVRPVYALVADESDARPGEYWTKTYVGKVARDGSFQVIISEPPKSNGILKTWFVFDNGAQTGNGKQRGRSSGIAKAYTYRGNRWIFE